MRQCAKPKFDVFFMCGQAFSDMCLVLDMFADRLPRIVVHCFTGTCDEVCCCMIRLGLS